MNFKHLKDCNMSYFQHMKRALTISISMWYGAICCFVHAFVPCIFVATATNMVKKLNKRYIIGEKNDLK